jgi:hypothetical protein
MPRTMKLTPQDVARILGSMARTNNKLARDFAKEDKSGAAEMFRERANSYTFAAKQFLEDEDDPRSLNQPKGWRLWAPEEIRVRASRRARNYVRRRPRLEVLPRDMLSTRPRQRREGPPNDQMDWQT